MLFKEKDEWCSFCKVGKRFLEEKQGVLRASPGWRAHPSLRQSTPALCFSVLIEQPAATSRFRLSTHPQLLDATCVVLCVSLAAETGSCGSGQRKKLSACRGEGSAVGQLLAAHALPLAATSWLRCAASARLC
jgi:hypothetical protein